MKEYENRAELKITKAWQDYFQSSFNASAPEAGKVRVLSSRTVPAIDLKRLGQWDTYITYVDHSGATHLVVVPKRTPLPSEVEQAVRADAKMHAQWVSQTYTI